LWLNQNEIYKEDDVVVFNVFVAEAAAVLAHGEPHAVAAGLVIGAGVFSVERLDWISAFYTDWHDSWTLITRWPCSLLLDIA
jgi:hypothetical protein